MENREIYHIISNTHWDREWYQSHEKYLVRLVSLFDRLLILMENEPRYRFVTDGQFALLDDYLAIRPENREMVKKLVESGRLQTGPWYTQPLENIVGGEALIRNLSYGIREAEKLGGAMRFSYEIDEFGHASQIPQILSGFGIKGAMAWRGIPKNSESVFEWTAPDGSSVFMFYSKAGYGFATALPEETENYDEVIDGSVLKRDGLKKCVEDLRNYCREYSACGNMFWLNGIDHSYAQEDLFPVMDKIRELFPSIEVRQSIPTELASAVLADYDRDGRKPACVKGELIYTREDILESTNALHPRQKIKHALSEFHLVHRLEPLSALAYMLGDKYPGWAVDRAWKYVLENHAHDSLGCCSVDEVFEQVMARYGAAISLCEQCEQDALRYIMSCSSAENSVFVFNLSSFAVSGVRKITLDIPSGWGDGYFELYTDSGAKVPVCVLERENCGDVRYNPRLGHPTWGEKCHAVLLAELPVIPAMGWLRLEYRHAGYDPDYIGNRREYHLVAVPGVMENEIISVRFNSDGTFDMTDKRNGRIYREQLRFEDTGEAGDVYVHYEPRNDMSRIFSCAPACITELYDTPLGCAYRVDTEMLVPDGLTADRKKRSDIKKPLKISAEITLLKGSDRLDIKIHAENRSRNHRLRVLFPSGLNKAVRSAGGQAFDCAYRDIHEPFDPELPREQAYPTKPMLDYCFVSDSDSGLGVGVKGLFEYECTDDSSRSLAVTLIRANDIIDTKTFAVTPEYICHEAQNITDIDFELSLIPFDGSFERFNESVTSFTDPVIAITNRQPEESVMPGYKRPAGILGACGKFAEVTGRGVVITSLKHSDKRDSVIIRILNTSESAVQSSVRLTVPGIEVKEIYSVDLEENRIAKKDFAGCLLAPHKLHTFEFVF